jgi:peptidoglycan hydrolase-like protein with peptidoglycan-binding domain
VTRRILAFAGFVAVSLLILTSTVAQADSRPARPGDVGAQVSRIQRQLAADGYTVVVDGRYGPQTTRAVRHWQRANRLTVDGVAGPETLASLLPATAGAPAVRVDPPTMTPEQIIRDVWPDDSEDHAVAIATRESRLIPTARNACCYGLFQINWPAHRSWLAAVGVTSPAQLLDARTNVNVALALFTAAGWGPWAL